MTYSPKAALGVATRKSRDRATAPRLGPYTKEKLEGESMEMEGCAPFAHEQSRTSWVSDLPRGGPWMLGLRSNLLHTGGLFPAVRVSTHDYTQGG